MKRLPLLFACIVAFISMNVFSAYAADLKIGIIDTQKIITDSEKILKYRADFTRELEEKKQEYAKKQAAAQALESELQTKGASMSPEVRRDKVDALQKEAKNLKRMQDDIESEMQAREAELSRKFLRQIKDLAVEYLEKEKFSLILEKNSVVASDDAIDITNQIIKIYDSKP
jgi:outer membrane protein